MKRRAFIKRAGMGLGSFWCLPAVAGFFSGIGPSEAYQLLPLTTKEGQIRHGLLDLPQLGAEAPPLAYDWLLDVSRNVFFKNGFVAGNDGQDLEIVSILLKYPGTQREDAVQIQHKASGSIVLMEDQEYALPHAGSDWMELERRKDENLRMVFGHLEASSEKTFQLKAKAEVFVFVLNGEAVVNEVPVSAHLGLGMETSEDLHFSVQSDTQLIIMENSKI